MNCGLLCALKASLFSTFEQFPMIWPLKSHKKIIILVKTKQKQTILTKTFAFITVDGNFSRVSILTRKLFVYSLLSTLLSFFVTFKTKHFQSINHVWMFRNNLECGESRGQTAFRFRPHYRNNEAERAVYLQPLNAELSFSVPNLYLVIHY